MDIEMITTDYNGVNLVFFGHVFEETDQAILFSGKIPFVDGGPVKGGEWIRKDTIKQRLVIMTWTTNDERYYHNDKKR